jgi:hypothetical protein
MKSGQSRVDEQLVTRYVGIALVSCCWVMVFMMVACAWNALGNSSDSGVQRPIEAPLRCIPGALNGLNVIL